MVFFLNGWVSLGWGCSLDVKEFKIRVCVCVWFVYGLNGMW